MTAFIGIIPPLCTPLDADGSVDKRSLERLVARQIDAGVHGVFALGSTGEAIYLTDRLRRQVVDVVVNTAAGAIKVLAGAVDGSTERVIDQVRWISEFRVDAVVVTAPFYANVSDAETVTHFERIAAASPFPVIAYDIPGNVGRKLPADVTIGLLQRKVIAGLKDTSGEIDEFFRILRSLDDRAGASMFSGADGTAAEWLAGGADGIVPGIGNVCPDLFVRLFDAHLKGDGAEVQRLQETIRTVGAILGVGQRHGLGLHASQLGALKYLLKRDGTFTTTVVSAPLGGYPEAAGREVLAIMESVGR